MAGDFFQMGANRPESGWLGFKVGVTGVSAPPRGWGPARKRPAAYPGSGRPKAPRPLPLRGLTGGLRGLPLALRGLRGLPLALRGLRGLPLGLRRLDVRRRAVAVRAVGRRDRL